RSSREVLRHGRAHQRIHPAPQPFHFLDAGGLFALTIAREQVVLVYESLKEAVQILFQLSAVILKSCEDFRMLKLGQLVIDDALVAAVSSVADVNRPRHEQNAMNEQRRVEVVGGLELAEVEIVVGNVRKRETVLCEQRIEHSLRHHLLAVDAAFRQRLNLAELVEDGFAIAHFFERSIIGPPGSKEQRGRWSSGGSPASSQSCQRVSHSMM